MRREKMTGGVQCQGKGERDAREREVAAALLGVPLERTCARALAIALALGWAVLWLGLAGQAGRIKKSLLLFLNSEETNKKKKHKIFYIGILYTKSFRIKFSKT